MDVLDAIVLGLVQGLTEFLPVSSTAHLVFACRWLGISGTRTPEQITAIVAVVQLGTLAAVMAWFARDLGAMARACARPRDPASRAPLRLLAWMILGTIPIGVLGLAFKRFIEGEWTKNLLVIAGSLAFWSVVLALADRFGKKAREGDAARTSDVLTIGLFQVFALIPGASRSGTTIAGGLLRGLTRETAARLSFLLSIPAIGAAGVLQLRSALRILDRGDLGMLALATAVAGVSGYVSIAWLLRFLRTRSTLPFVAYRIALAALLAAMVLSGRWSA
ncbi:MAG: undecaprenyl-diphosphate phosphatase [Candidatus Brocadiae bacterium]|nr:undecaprenyl-diphosphate phosphatase [Candidatus Brocadiia bacterium]